MKKCPYCAEDIQKAAIKCKHCGQWLNKEPIFKKVYNALKKYYLANNVFVDQVKEDFNQAKYGGMIISPPRKSISGWIFYIGGGIIGLIIGLIAYLFVKLLGFSGDLIDLLSLGLILIGVTSGRILHKKINCIINKENDDKTTKDAGTTSSHDSKSSNETVNITTITINQIAKGVVQIPHLPNELNKKALNCLIEAFEIVDEEKKELLK